MSSRPLRKRIKYTAIYWAVLFTIFISRLVPRTLWLSLFGLIGRIVYSFPSRFKDLVIHHLGLAFAKEKTTREILELSKEVYVMLAKNGADVIRSWSVRTREDLDKFVVFEGKEYAERAKAKGKGVIYFTGHIGAFELMITAMGLNGLPFMVIGTALKDERLNDIVVQFRAKHGSEPIQRGRETFKLIKTLKSGGAVGMLIDQDTKVKSRFVNFFGMPASTPVGAALMAMKTGAAVVPALIHLGKDNLQHMVLYPEVEMVNTGDEEQDMITNTQTLTTILEEAIRRNPAQWVWMHERWKTKPGEEER
ncbi:MAG: lysophospholipid acyltransferase family protein [Cyclobacteriaceae bacterium]|nr:lysophospholipid acyltransferase family protein [Cyclobacteriaceae bacterium]